MAVVELLPEAELCPAFQRGQLGVFQHDEELVGGGVHKEVAALGGEALLEGVGRLDGVAADAGVEVVGEEDVELDAHEAALGQQSALLLDHGHEVGRCAVGEDHGLAAECAHLGAADVEDVGEPGEVGQGHIGAFAHQCVAQTCAVHEEGHVVGVADGGQGLELSLAVQGAVLGGVGDIHHAGEDHVVVVRVGVEGLAEILHRGGIQLAVLLGQADDLVAGELDGTRLMTGHMAGGGGDDALPAAERGGDDDGVGLGAAGDEEDVGLGAGAGGAYLLLCAGAVGVGAVAGHLLEVRFRQLLQDGGMRTLAVVVLKIQHILSLSFIMIKKMILL